MGVGCPMERCNLGIPSGEGRAERDVAESHQQPSSQQLEGWMPRSEERI